MGRYCSRDFYLPENEMMSFKFTSTIEYGIFGEGSQISTNHNRESTVFSLLIS